MKSEFDKKTQEDRALQQQKLGESERLMKASHFNIGRPDAKMVPPKPISPIQPTVDFAPSVNIKE